MSNSIVIALAGMPGLTEKDRGGVPGWGKMRSPEIVRLVSLSRASLEYSLVRCRVLRLS